MVSWLTLDDEQTAHADHVARMRQDSAVKHRRKPKNGAPLDAGSQIRINYEGARAERAGKAYLDFVFWHELADDLRNLPDLHDFIDVKGTILAMGNLVVQLDDPAHWAYLLVRIHRFPQCEVTGWAWGHEAQKPQLREELQKGRPAYVMRHGLRPPSELYDELRRRQAAE